MSKLFYACFAAVLFAATSPAQKPAAQTQSSAGAQIQSPAAKKSALDKAVLEAYVRHLYVMDSRIAVKVSDPKPSEVAGFFDVNVHASMGLQSQDLKFLVSKDGSKILQANVFDVDNNPFKHDLDLLKTDRAPAMGTKGAPVALVEFSDFQCPYCKAEAQELRKNLLAAYPTQVRLYFKTFPLEQLHPWAKAAAIASRCVYKQKPEAFWTYHDWIFEHQAEITPENLKDKVLGWAKDTQGIDSLQLGQCMETKATEKDVAEDQAEGEKLEVGGTPTLFINGRRISNVVDWPSLKNIIDYEIEYQKTAHNAGDDCGCTLELKLPGALQVAPAASIKKP
jgi:protein-disulfide isomerase